MSLLGAAQDPRREPELVVKLNSFHLTFILFVVTLCVIGVSQLYAAGGPDGSWTVYATDQIIRLSLGFIIAIGVSLLSIQWLHRLSWYAYLAAVILLVVVLLVNDADSGVRRWIDFGLFNLQPSELAQLAIIAVLASYFNEEEFEHIGNLLFLLPPVLIITVPAMLILIQPDLGTALKTLGVGAVVIFAAGVRWWKILLVIALIGALLSIVVIDINHYRTLSQDPNCQAERAAQLSEQVSSAGQPCTLRVLPVLRDFQRRRILTFLYPEEDTGGDAYQITQAKTIVSLAGLTGFGYLNADYAVDGRWLPERHTDFIFILLIEQFGIMGGLVVLLLYGLLILAGFWIALSARSIFGRLLAIGVTGNLFLYVFVNMGMVLGILPVVGIPLPFMSHGGTVAIVAMLSVGLLQNVWIHRQVVVGRFDRRDPSS